MTQHAKDAEAIFLAALDKATLQERAAYLEAICAGDLELLGRVHELLGCHEGSQGPLDAPPPGLGSTVGLPASSEQPGTLIGPYKLLQQIGEGGMGTVFMAEQQHPVRRKVAVKLIKPGMDSRQVIVRFEAERQALALMDHPNIAKVLDAGATESGRPFFVMELVKGVPITRYCDEHHLTPRERLELFVPVCQAVQHAHHKGVIHRDMKPSNVMVCIYDGKPVTKVIDFGMAKATGAKLTDRTLFTEFGAIVGTFEYMSPEQAELDQSDIDTRSDIYSLGVLLYELLTGTTPLERKRMKEVAILELLRLVREEEAPRPSVRLSTTEGLPSIAANRGTEPKRMSGLMRGELDWIVMKCIEKDRNRRYDTANAFAADVLNYLHGEAVLACPPSATYRMRKFARRNRAAFWTTSVVALALVVGTVVSAWQAVRATRAEGLADARLTAESRARQDADANFQTARKAVDDYLTVVGSSPLLDAPGMEPLRKQLLETALRYNLEFIQQRGDDARLQADVAAAHIRVAEITFLVGGSFDQWFPHMRVGVDTISQMIAEGRDTPETQERLARIRLTFGTPESAPTTDSENQLIFRYLRQQAQNWEKFIRDNPQVPEFQDGLAAVSLYLANGIFYGSEAVSLSDRTIEIWEKLKRDHPEVPSYRINLARAYELRGNIIAKTTRTPQADEAYQKALLLRRELAHEFPGKDSHTAWLAATFRTLGEAQNARDQPKQAEQTLRQALNLQQKLVADFPAVHAYQDDLARTQLALAAALKTLGRSQDAQAAYRQALGGFERLVIAFPRAARYQTQLLQAAKDLAELLEASGQARKKKEVLDLVFAVYENLTAQSAKTPADLKAMALVYQNLANLLRNNGQPKEAEKAYGKGLDLLRKRAAEFPAILSCREDLGNSCRIFAEWLQGPEKDKEREQLLGEALKIFERLSSDSPDKPTYRAQIGWRCRDLAKLFARCPNRLREAEEMRARDASAFEKLTAEFSDNPSWPEHLGHAQRLNAFELRGLNRAREAAKSFREAIKVLEKSSAKFPHAVPSHSAMLADTYLNLAALLRDTGAPREAEDAYRKGFDLYEKLAADVAKNPAAGRELASSLGSFAGWLRYQNRNQEAEPAFRRALALWEKLVAESPSNDHYRLQLGNTLWQLADLSSTAGRHDEATKTLRRALDVFEKLAADFPKNPHYRVEQGFTHWKLGWLMNGLSLPREAEGPFRQALAVYKKLAADYPQNQDYRVRLSQSYNYLAEVLVRQGKHAEAAGQWDNAAAEYTKAIELKPDAWEAWSGRAFVHSGRQQWDRAIADFSRAIDLAPQVHTNWWHRGHVYLQLAHWDKAAADFGKVVDQWPDGSEGWYLRAVAFAQLNQPDKALADLRQALAKGFNNVEQMKNDPKLAPLLTREDFGRLLEELERKEKLRAQGKQAEAEEALRQALAAGEKLVAESPTVPLYRDSLARSHHDLASLLRRNRQFSEGEKAYRRAIAIWEKLGRDVPSQPMYRVHAAVTYAYDLAAVLAARGQSHEAEEATRQSVAMFEKLAAEFPKDGHEGRLTDCRVKLAVLLAAAGRFQEAERAYSKILELAPKNALILNNLAWLLANCPDRKLRDPSRALKTAKQAVELAPKEGNYWNTLGVAHYRAGDWKDAIVALEKSMEPRKGGDAFDWFFLAMAHWKLDEKEQARKWYDQAVQWMDKNTPKDDELIRFRAEAAELFGNGKKRD